jgi:hypothetical protein
MINLHGIVSHELAQRRLNQILELGFGNSCSCNCEAWAGTAVRDSWRRDVEEQGSRIREYRSQHRWNDGSDWFFFSCMDFSRRDGLGQNVLKPAPIDLLYISRGPHKFWGSGRLHTLPLARAGPVYLKHQFQRSSCGGCTPCPSPGPALYT